MSSQLVHIDIQDLFDDQCFGEMVSEDVYKEGQLVDRFYTCAECGMWITEKQLVDIEEELELEMI